MRKSLKKKILWISLWIVVAIALFFFVRVSFFSIAGGELGWIPYATLNNQFSNVSIHPGCTSCIGFCGSLGDDKRYIHSSEYWTAIGGNGGVFCNGNYGALSTVITGGDSNINVGNYYDIVKFNKNLKNIYFAVDYTTGNGPYAGVPSIDGSLLSKSGNGKVELRPSILVDGESNLYINGQFIKTINTLNGYYLQISSGGASVPGHAQDKGQTIITLSNPRWKPLFDCKIDNDEVLLFDEFTNSTTFNIYDLTYPVKKFCVNQPPVIRSFTERGITTDTNGEILIKLSEGGSIKVKPDQTIRVPYITTAQTGILRCQLTEAFNTKTKKCENILSEGLPDSIGGNITFIEIGENQVSYTQTASSSSLFIGDLVFNPSAQTYLCSCEKQGRLTPGSNPGCYRVTINNQNVIDGSVYKLNDYVTANYKASGYGVFNGLRSDGNMYTCSYTSQNDWINEFMISFDKAGLRVTEVSNITNTTLNTISYLKLKLDNEIANFQESGFKIRKIDKIVDRITDSYYDAPISKGIKDYTIPVSQDILGDVVIEVTPYFKVQDKQIFGNSKAVFNINSGQTEIVIIIEKNKVNTYLIIILGILVLVIITLILFLKRRRR